MDFKLGSVVLLLSLTALISCDRNTAPAARAPAPAQAGPVRTVAEFHLPLPESWSGRYRLEKIEGAAAASVVPDAMQVVEYLYLPAAAELREQPLLMVVVLNQIAWQARQQEEPSLGELLAGRDGYAYIAALPQANPYGKDGEDARRFDAMQRELPAVKAGFTLTGGLQ